MARWYSQGMRSVRLNGSRVEPEPGPPDEAAWAIDDLRAAEALVATVLLGERYTGWHQMVLLATQEAT
jgi:hypothetical protein